MAPSTNNNVSGEKRKLNKSESKRPNKRNKTSESTVARAKDDGDKEPDTTNDSVKPPSTSSSSSQTIDETFDGEPLHADDNVETHSDNENASADVIEQSAIRPSDAADVGFNVKGEIITFNTPNVNPLNRVNEQGGRFKGVRDVDNLPFCELADYFMTNRTKALRVLRYAAEAVGNNMTNIFTANPDEFDRVVTNSSFQSRRVVYKNSMNVADGARMDSTFFTVGRVVRCALLDKNNNAYVRELSIQPIHRFAPRMVSVIAQILDFRHPLFPLRDDGLQITTTRKPFDEKSKGPTIRNAQMNGVTHGPSPRPWNEDVPIFDGRSRFQLFNYATMEHVTDELEVGDFALVAFTVAGWRNNRVAAVDPRAERVSLNIQFAILLERPVENDQHGVSVPITDEMKDETPLGVKDVRPMKHILPNELTDAEVSSQIHTLSATFDGPAM